jgi:P4 family phage/plasmid primase-like protien
MTDETLVDFGEKLREKLQAVKPEEAIIEEAIAANFALIHAAGLRYVAAWSKWMLWGGDRWVEDDTLAAFDMVRQECRTLRGYLSGASQKTQSLLGSAKLIAAVERLAKSDRRLAATAGQWDSDPDVFNTHEGPVRREDYVTKVAAVSPATPGTPCPRWTPFLDEVTCGNIQLQKYLQRVAGYCLTGHTSEHALFFLWGTGANGKSTFINTLTWIWGDYAVVADMEVLVESTNDRHPTELARLRGARLVAAQEVGQDRRWAEGRIKVLTGGDPITARFMRQDFFTYTPQFKLLIAGNHKPGLRGVDEAIRRRLHLIPFTVQIPPANRDPDLLAKLREEGPAILRWALDGRDEWRAQGLNPPAAVRDATAEYFEDEDMFGQWITEFISEDRFSFETSSDLYASWKRWAETAGLTAGSQKAFVQQFANQGFRQERTKKARGFKGIRLSRRDYTDDPRYGG